MPCPRLAYISNYTISGTNRYSHIHYSKMDSTLFFFSESFIGLLPKISDMSNKGVFLHVMTQF